MWDWLKETAFRTFWNKVGDAAADADAPGAEEVRSRATAAPIIWLLGKTGAGKTSIVAAITGESRAKIGNGFSRCTSQSQIYDWPADAPILRFLDTRGLEEVAYDPAEDIAFAEEKAHILLGVMNIKASRIVISRRWSGPSRRVARVTASGQSSSRRAIFTSAIHPARVTRIPILTLAHIRTITIRRFMLM
jgi:hypothetical protein